MLWAQMRLQTHSQIVNLILYLQPGVLQVQGKGYLMVLPD